ncbi:MAG: hypothetical protein Q8P50_09245, partial [Bacillota bacterium]|nr:hypothetical protein [Bacillota bacterium]
MSADKSYSLRGKPISTILMMLFLLSGSLFSLEFLLTRVFSYLLWYHYVFIVVSVAVMGMGIGAWWVQSRLGKGLDTVSMTSLILVAIGAYAIIITTLYFNVFDAMPGIYVMVGVIPFVAGGAISSIVFSARPESANALYFADLSGTAIFGALTVFLLNQYGMTVSILALFATLLAAG